MRYENILQVYWPKGFFFGGNLFYFNISLENIINILQGFSSKFFYRILQRFELTFFTKVRDLFLIDACKYNHKVISSPLNIILSQINSVNNVRFDLYKLNLIRLYLIKSYRGRCHALGKPSRGQRTWSNAWNAYKLNSTLRSYISLTNKQHQLSQRVERINYKITQKKYGVQKKKLVRKNYNKKIIWF